VTGTLSDEAPAEARRFAAGGLSDALSGSGDDAEPDWRSQRPHLAIAHAEQKRAAARARQERADAGLLHVIERCSFGEGRSTLCVCGEQFSGRTDDEMSLAWARHVRDKRGRARMLRS